MNWLFRDLQSAYYAHCNCQIPIPTTVPLTFSELCRTKAGKAGFLEIDARTAGVLRPCRRILADNILT